jgi:four helix bundle protein
MMQEEKIGFNEVFRERTRKLALAVIKLFEILKKSEESRIIGKQVLRSATSVAANYRAACRARSSAEYYSKLCIVIEECDETLFWFELIESAGFIKSEQLKELIAETYKLLAVFAKTRKTLKSKN